MIQRHAIVSAILAAGVAAWPVAVQADPIPAVQSASNMQIIGHSDLNGAGMAARGWRYGNIPTGGGFCSWPTSRHRCASASST